MYSKRYNRLLKTPYPHHVTTSYGFVLKYRTEINKYKKHVPVLPDLTFLNLYSKELPTVVNITCVELERDIDRTFSNYPLFDSLKKDKVHKVMLAVITSFGNYLPQLIHVVATLIFVSNNENMAFGVTMEIIHTMPDYFNDEMVGIKADVNIIEDIISSELEQQFCQDCLKICSQWLLSCFTSNLPLYASIEAIELSLIKRQSGLTSLALAILQKTLSLHSIEAIKHYPETIYKPGKVRDLVGDYEITNFLELHNNKVQNILYCNNTTRLHIQENIKFITNFEDDEVICITERLTYFKRIISIEQAKEITTSNELLYILFNGTMNSFSGFTLFCLIVWCLTDDFSYRCKILYCLYNKSEQNCMLMIDLNVLLHHCNEIFKIQGKNKSISLDQIKKQYPVQIITFECFN
ncbi:Rab-GAP TBC domain-containing protein [Entamoeba marina]